MDDTKASEANPEDKLEKEAPAADSAKKVQLDIEDAPFLSEAKEEENPEARKEEATETFDSSMLEGGKSKEPVQPKSKKVLVLAIAALVLIIVALGAAWFFFFYSSGPSKDKAEEAPTIIVVPSSESITGPPEYKVIFAPFTIEEQAGTSVSFLQATFIGISKDEKVLREAQGKELVLRDAIYYYLRNKKHAYLIDQSNVVEIKKDLLDIVNGYLSSGKMEDMLLENYVVK